MSKAELGFRMIAGYKPPLSNIKMAHPMRGESQLPALWLNFGSNPVGGQERQLLIFGSTMRREFTQQGELSSALICYSLDGVEPFHGAKTPQSTTCEVCPVSEECHFVHTIIAMDEVEGFCGRWNLRGMAGERWSQFLGSISTVKDKELQTLPIRVTVKPTIVFAQREYFSVPQFTLNRASKLSKEAKETAQLMLSAKYDVKL